MPALGNLNYFFVEQKCLMIVALSPDLVVVLVRCRKGDFKLYEWNSTLPFKYIASILLQSKLLTHNSSRQSDNEPEARRRRLDSVRPFDSQVCFMTNNSLTRVSLIYIWHSI